MHDAFNERITNLTNFEYKTLLSEYYLWSDDNTNVGTLTYELLKLYNPKIITVADNDAYVYISFYLVAFSEFVNKELENV